MRAKYRGRQEPGPGRGLPALAATLTQPKQATPSTTSSVKNSEAARPERLLPGNLDCVATETTPLAERDRAGQGEQQGQKASPRLPAGQGLAARKCTQARGTTPGARWEERGRKGTGRKGDGETERGGFRSTSFSLPLPLPLPGSGLPHPPQGALLGNSWERVRSLAPARAVIKVLISPAAGGTWVGAPTGREEPAGGADPGSQQPCCWTSKPPTENKAGVKQKPASQQWQMDLLLHKKQCLT